MWWGQLGQTRQLLGFEASTQTGTWERRIRQSTGARSAGPPRPRHHHLLLSSQGTDSGCLWGERREAGGGDSGRSLGWTGGSPMLSFYRMGYVLDGASCLQSTSPLPACHVTMTAQEGKDFNMDSTVHHQGCINCDPRLLALATIFPNTPHFRDGETGGPKR